MATIMVKGKVVDAATLPKRYTLEEQITLWEAERRAAETDLACASGGSTVAICITFLDSINQRIADLYRAIQERDRAEAAR